MNKAIFLSLLTALGSVTVASAQPPAPATQQAAACGHGPHARPFAKLDVNQDGSISRSEMLGRATERFDRADANKDGTLTTEERKAAHQRFAEEHFKKSDRNGDGALASDELPPRFAKKLGKLDANKDGKLTQAELSVLREKFARRFAQQRPESAAPKSRTDLVTHVNARFDKLDANQDGALSKQELGKGRFGNHDRRGRHG
jgi:Ca2+-binding EF-hand superfamily protein